jgi:uncharacterized protein (DUF362 family)
MKMKNNNNSFVAVCHGNDAYVNAYNALNKLNLSGLAGKNVLLKPNAGRKVLPNKGITTNPLVVAAACDFFKEAGAIVTVGEGTILGVTPFDCLESTGIAAEVRKRGIPMIDLDVAPANKIEIKDSVVLNHARISSAIFDFDYIVSIPVIKTHMHCKVTLSLKNMKGCLKGREKVRLHQLPQPEIPTDEKTLDLAIADLSTVLKPDIVLIDGSVCMEGLGPSAGTTKCLNIALASTNYFAADAVAASLMGLNPEEIPHLRLAAARAGESISIDDINVNPPSWQEWIQPFELPPKEISLNFPKVEVLDCESCSACVSTLTMFLKRNYEDIADYLPMKFAIGKGHTEIPENTLCVGNCTLKKAGKNTLVKGCPPVASDILKALTDN